MITFGIAHLHDVYEEIKPNVARHYAEMSDGDDYGTPEIDWDSYLAASRANRCVVVTVRDEKKLVGYSVYSLGANPRYKNLVMASSDGIFLEKPYRGKLSRQLIKKADEYLKNIGVHETVYILSDDRVGQLLSRDGYQSKYKVWSHKYG